MVPAIVTAKTSETPSWPPAPPAKRSAIGSTPEAMSTETRLARRRASRHQESHSRDMIAPNVPRAAKAGIHHGTSAAEAPPDRRDRTARPAPVEVVPIIADSSVVDHHHSSSAIAPAVIAARSANAPHWPSATSNGSTYGAPSGVHEITLATPIAWETLPLASTATPSHCSGPISEAPIAMSTAARSRIRRDRSMVANALV